MNLENSTEFTSLNFRNNAVEKNYEITWKDVINMHIERKFPSYVNCICEQIDLNLGNKLKLMHKECLKTKHKVRIVK